MSDAHPGSHPGVMTGLGVLVTRDTHQAPDLSQRLKALGANVFEFPVIEITKPESTTALDDALAQLESYDWIVFASTNSVDYFLARMKSLNISVDQLVTRSLAVVGAKTVEKLQNYGLRAKFCPEIFSASAFVKEFPTKHAVEKKRILWPRTNVGKLLIKEGLEKTGAIVDAVIAYETHLPAESAGRREELRELLNSGKIQIITITSSQAARNLHSLLNATSDFRLRGIKIASIGSETHKTAEELFECECIQSEEFSIPGLVAMLEKHAKSRGAEQR